MLLGRYFQTKHIKKLYYWY